jgi:hypothetical protein
VPNSPSCESVLREIVFGLNSLRHVTAPFRTQQCPHPLAASAKTTDGQGVSRRDLMIPQHSGRIERPAARGGVGEGGGGALEQQLRRRRGREADRVCGAEKHRPADKPYVSQHPELAARAVAEARAGEDPRKASRWAVMCANRRQFEREHAEDLRRSAIFIKYTVGCFISESIQSINRDDVAICRSFAACQPFSQSFLPAIS